MKRYSYLLAVVLSLCCLSFGIGASASDTGIQVLINGRMVAFTEDSGHPFVDGNDRTLVPLRATMEAAGFAVGYDAAKQTAIVITENDRIEVPVGKDIIYKNNAVKKNDTTAVIYNDRMYLPIRAVLEAAGFTVEWDGQTKTVNAYTFRYDPNEFVPYSTSDPDTLLRNVAEGNVVYINGQYYATPSYVKMLTNVKVYYSGSDLNTAIYPKNNRYGLLDIEI